MKRTILKAITFSICICMCLSMFVCLDADKTYAASKPARVSVTSVKSIEYDTIKVTWKTAKRAQKYQVYRATSINGKYEIVATTTKKYFTDKGLTFNKKYYYKVRGVRGTKKGSFSSAKYAITKLNVPSVDIETGWIRNTIDIQPDWDNCLGANGIEVYRSESKSGTYDKAMDITQHGVESDIVPANDKVYYYKYRAYRMSGSKKVYSAFTSAVNGYAHDYNADLNSKISASIQCIETGENPKFRITVANNTDSAIEYMYYVVFKDREGCILDTRVIIKYPGEQSTSTWTVSLEDVKVNYYSFDSIGGVSAASINIGQSF